ncbi:MAG: AI-2E family transporter [Eubacterium sp.]|nr:AI-2E family transporter [Eubacterium sp.]
MKRLNERQKRYFYIGLTLFISLSLVQIVASYFTKAELIANTILAIIGALTSVWIGLIIAYLTNPIMMFFEKKIFLKIFGEKKKGAARALSVTCSILLLLTILIGILVLVIPQLIETLSTLVKNFPTYWKNVEAFAQNFANDHPSIGGKVMEFVDGAGDKLMNWLQNDLLRNANILGTITSGLMGAVGFIINFFVGIIIAIYLLIDKENFLMQSKKFTASVFSEKWYTRIMTICSETHHVFGEFITGKIVDSILVGIVNFLFMTIVGIPYATLVSVLLAVCNLIPFFGQFIGIIPSFLLILVIDPMKAFIWLVVIIVYMQIDANVISPKILGNSIGLGSFWILFSIIFFGGMFGVVGMLVGVPVFAMIYRFVTKRMDRHLQKKGLPTEAYIYAEAGPTYPDRKNRRKLEGHFGDLHKAEAAGESSEGNAGGEPPEETEPPAEEKAEETEAAEEEKK